MIRACAFSREGARPRSTRHRSSRRFTLASGLPFHDQAGELLKAIGARSKRGEAFPGLLEQLPGQGAGSVQAVEAHVGRLVRGPVLARGLAQLLRVPGGVEDVI